MSLKISRSRATGWPDVEQPLRGHSLEFHVQHISTQAVRHMKRLPKLKLEEVIALGYFLVLVMAGMADWSLMRQASRIRAEAAKHATVGVEGMCCEFIASAMLRELNAIPGVIGMTPDFQAKTVRVELHRSQKPSAKAIWVAIERTPVRPMRLVLNSESFLERPLE